MISDEQNPPQKASFDYRQAARRLMSDHGTTIILLLMLVVMAFASPSFLKLSNLMNVVRQVSVIAIVGIGVTMIIITRGIDLASGSVIAVVSVVSASFPLRLDWP